MKLTEYQKNELVWMRDQGEKWAVISRFYVKSVGHCCSIYKKVKRGEQNKKALALLDKAAEAGSTAMVEGKSLLTHPPV